MSLNQVLHYAVTDWAHYNHGYTGNILNFQRQILILQKVHLFIAENLQKLVDASWNG
jgi:hypothetical protein